MTHIDQIDISALEISLILTAKTPSSASYEVITSSRTLASGSSVGWVQVHHPCLGHIRLHIRGVLPERLLNQDSIKGIVSAIQSNLQIPAEETMDVVMCSQKAQIGISQATDTTGKIGRIETTRKFEAPKHE